MLKIVKSVLIISMIIGFTGCNSKKDIDVVQVAVKKVNFEAYTTYAPLLSTGLTIDSTGYWIPKDKVLNGEFIYRFKKEMSKKGKIPVITNPDFYVVAAIGVDMNAIKMYVSKPDQIKLANVPEASLVIVFIDANNGDIIWMAEAAGDFKEKLNLAKKRDRIEYTVKRMLNGL